MYPDILQHFHRNVMNITCNCEFLHIVKILDRFCDFFHIYLQKVVLYFRHQG